MQMKSRWVGCLLVGWLMLALGGVSRAQTWSQVFTDSFARANSTTVGNGWTDAASVFAITSNTLTSTNTTFSTSILYRPASETTQNMRVVTTETVYGAGGPTGPMHWLHGSGTSGIVYWFGFDATLNASVLTFANISAGTLSASAISVTSSTYTTASRNSGSYYVASLNATSSSGIDYTLDTTIVGSTVTIKVINGGSTIATIVFTDSANTSAGFCALSPIVNPSTVKSVTTYSQSGTPTPTISPSAPAVLTNGTQTFTASVANDIGSAGVSWSLVESALIGSAAGALSGNTTTGVTYTAPTGAGTYHLVATALATGGVTATVPITVNPPPINQFVVLGNSLAAGLDSGTTPPGFPPVTSAILGPGWAYNNQGVSGQTTTQMIAQIATQATANYDATTYPGKQVAIVWEGTNDLFLNGLTGTQAYNNIVSYCNSLRAVGYWVVVLTVLPRSNTGTPVGQEIARLTLNALLRANSATFANALADVAGDVRIGLYGDQLGTYYYQLNPGNNGDFAVHLLASGHQIVGSIVATAILNMKTVAVVATVFNPFQPRRSR